MKHLFSVLLVICFFLPASLHAQECKGGGDEVLVRVTLLSDAVFYQEVFFEWPVLTAYLDHGELCVAQRDLSFQALDASVSDGKKFDLFAIPTSPLRLRYKVGEKSYQLSWSVDLIGVNALPEYQSGKEELKPACLLERLVISEKDSAFIDSRQRISIDSKVKRPEACQGAAGLEELIDARLPAMHQWYIDVAVITLREGQVADKTLTEKASSFFSRHPTDEDAKKRLKKK